MPEMLGQGEHISIRIHRHWIAWVGGPLWWLVYYSTVGIVLGARLLIWYYAYFVVTNHRVFMASGVFSKYSQECTLGHIQNLTYKQSLFGRMLGYGDVVVQSTVGVYTFNRIPDPERVRNTIAALIVQAKQEAIEQQAAAIGQHVALGLGAQKALSAQPPQQ